MVAGGSCWYKWPGTMSKVLAPLLDHEVYLTDFFSFFLKKGCHHLPPAKNMQQCEGHTPTSLHKYKQVARATHQHKQHLRGQLLFLCWCPPLPSTLATPPPLPRALNALVSWYSGWLVKWTCLLTALDKLSGLLISVTTTSLACSACMVDSTLNFIHGSFLFNFHMVHWLYLVWVAEFLYDGQ